MGSDSPRSPLLRATVLVSAAILGASLPACEALLGFGDEPRPRPASDASAPGEDASDASAADSETPGDGTVDTSQGDSDAAPDSDAALDHDAGFDADSPLDSNASDAGPGGHIVFTVGVDPLRLRRVAAAPGAAWEDIEGAILAANPPMNPDAGTPNRLRRTTLSADGHFLALTTGAWTATDEFAYVIDPATWGKQSMAVEELDGSGTSGAPMWPVLVASGGLSAVFEHPVAATWDAGGTALSVFRTTRTSSTKSTWSVPQRLFPSSFEMQGHVIGDYDAVKARVLTACGNEPGINEARQAVCESTFSQNPPSPTVRVRATDQPVSHAVQFSHPVYLGDDLIFDANWIEGNPNLTQLWRRDQGLGQIVRISPSGRYDRAACILPSGHIAAIAKVGDFDKIRVMTADGEELFLIETGAAAHEPVQVELGLSCSE